MILFITSIMVITLVPNIAVGFLTEKGSHLSPLAEESIFPSPHIIILGATGTDKSNLVNVLLGQDVNCRDCTFPICEGNNSCSEEMRYAIGQWIGVGENFTIVNTPDFEGSDSDDSELITSMINSLHDVIRTARGFLLTFRVDQDGFDSKIHQMIQAMESAFGRGFWHHVLLQFTNWHFDANSVSHRNRTGRDEEWKTWTINEALQERFQLDFNLSAVFIDPNAKQDWNINHENEQVAFNREAYKAWEKIDDFCHFEFKTVEDFKADLSDCRNEVLYLNDVITKNITELTNKIADLAITHIEDIVALTKTHTEDMAKISKDFANLKTSPIGTIAAWVSKPESGGQTVDIPDGWQRCDGSVISQPSIWAGKHTPDLNHGKRFLRGGEDNDMLTMEEDQAELRSHSHSIHDDGHTHGYYDVQVIFNHDGCLGSDSRYDEEEDCWRYSEHKITDQSSSGIKVNSYGYDIETRPKNMNVIYIMRVW